tara:strand:+ start:418 stop:540 length:123 start_codon:yes stop_codon:yes gene_type:complete
MDQQLFLTESHLEHFEILTSNAKIGFLKWPVEGRNFTRET